MSRIRDEFSSEIQEAAQSMVERLPITVPQLRKLSDEEVKQLHDLMETVDKATDENEKIAAAQKSAGSVVKLLGGL